MADPFIAEIRVFGFNFAPVNWALCNGQLMQIRQNTALFAVIGTAYGGDGVTTFGLPNLQANTPVDAGNGIGLTPRVLGERLGSTTVTLDPTTMPAHTHTIVADVINNTPLAQLTPLSTSFIARNFGEQIYVDGPGTAAAMDARMIGSAGGGQPHPNMQPYLVMNFCICLSGVYPPRS